MDKAADLEKANREAKAALEKERNEVKSIAGKLAAAEQSATAEK